MATATPKTVTEPMIKVLVKKAIFLDLNPEETKKMEKDFKNGAARKKNYTAAGMTKRIEAGEEIEVSKEQAKHFQKAGAVDIVL